MMGSHRAPGRAQATAVLADSQLLFGEGCSLGSGLFVRAVLALPACCIQVVLPAHSAMWCASSVPFMSKQETAPNLAIQDAMFVWVALGSWLMAQRSSAWRYIFLGC